MMVSRQIARQVIAGTRDPYRGAWDLEMIWHPEDEPIPDEVGTISHNADSVIWDPEYQRYRPTATRGLIESFARLAKGSPWTTRPSCPRCAPSP